MRIREGHAPSLRSELLRWLLLPMLLLIPVTAGLMYLLAARPALGSLDRALADVAVALSQIVEVDGAVARLPLSGQTARALQADLFDETVFAVGDADGRLLGGSAALLRQAPTIGEGGWRFFESTLDGKPVRVAAHTIACGDASRQLCSILVAETLGKRRAAQRETLLAALLGASAVALPMLLLALIAVERGMRPLRAAAAQVQARSPDHLAPIDTRAVPLEAAPFIEALNDLFGRVREAAAAQRAFIADAAHQLRTPLAVLRVEAEQALHSAHPPQLGPTLERLFAASARAARLAHQLLALARAEASTLDVPRQAQAFDLAELATQAADEWVGASLRAGQDLGFALSAAWLVADRVLLAELLNNLIHNAIEHAGPGARITVRTHTLEGRACLVVEDDGRGVEAQEIPALWERFHRGRGAQGAGSGLGLAIVRDIVRLHDGQAQITQQPNGKGLVVAVSFLSTRP